MSERRDPMVACLRASVKVRDGRWLRGAPSHVLAEFLNALAEDGWVLTYRSPVCEDCGGRGWHTVIATGRYVADDPETGWGNATTSTCAACHGTGVAQSAALVGNLASREETSS